jgi:hypothetical protein
MALPANSGPGMPQPPLKGSEGSLGAEATAALPAVGPADAASKAVSRKDGRKDVLIVLSGSPGSSFSFYLINRGKKILGRTRRGTEVPDAGAYVASMNPGPAKSGFTFALISERRLNLPCNIMLSPALRDAQSRAEQFARGQCDHRATSVVTVNGLWQQTENDWNSAQRWRQPAQTVVGRADRF